MNLTAENVDKIFTDCLFKDEENTENYVLAEGINIKIGFHPKRLEKNRQEIILMLEDLSDDFKQSKEMGSSFLAMCEDKNQVLWTGLHQTVEKLLCLGLAIEKLAYLTKREFWNILPGGMPYLVYKDI